MQQPSNPSPHYPQFKQQPPNPSPHYPQFKQHPQPHTYYPPQQQWQQPPPPPRQQWNPQQQPLPPQLYPQPPYYQPPMPPPKKNSKKFIAVVLGIVVATVLLGCIGMLVLASMKSQTAQQTATNQSSVTQAVQQPTQAAQQPTIQTTPKPSQQPTPKPTVQPTKAIAVTHGTPHIGGPISDFYGKYGQSNNQGFGHSETWIVDQQQQTTVNATPNASGEVTGVTVTSGSNWNDSQMQTYCSQFLPSDASEFNSTSNLSDYYSSVGEIVLQLEQASCVIAISGQ